MKTLTPGLQALAIILTAAALPTAAAAMGEGGEIKAERIAERARLATQDAGRAKSAVRQTATKIGRVQTHGLTGRTNTSYQPVHDIGHATGLTGRTSF